MSEMKNEDLPAFPIGDAQSSFAHLNTVLIGLTKREYIATIVLQAIISKNGTSFIDPHKEAVKQANMLLKELEKFK